MKTGRYNVGVGLLVMAGFMLYGFVLIYLRDFAPDKEAWAASYSVGKHFEARLAHVHGNLFALLNLALGFVLVRLASAASGFVTGALSAWPDYLRGQLAAAPALEAFPPREAHGVLVFALLGLVALHVGGVLVQQVRQGGVLRRMVPFLK